jgi:hypothetical protein
MFGLGPTNIRGKTPVIPPVTPSLSNAMLVIPDFPDRCQTLYTNRNDSNDANFLLVNVGLFFLFAESRYQTQDDSLKEDYKAYYHLCQTNIEVTLTNLRLLWPARMESVEALLLGVSNSIYSTTLSTIEHICAFFHFKLWLINVDARLCMQ